jgi:hypothetical protein
MGFLKFVNGLFNSDKEFDQPKSVDPNVERIREEFLQRSNRGFEKYGVTTTRTDLELIDWLQHLKEELMDATIYIEASIQQLNNNRKD